VSDFHTREAERLLNAMPSSTDVLLGHEVVGAATAHAVLALQQTLAEISEQQRLANVIAAIHAAIVYLHSHIGDIVNPESENR